MKLSRDHITCPLCLNAEIREFWRDARREYYHCPLCDLLLVPPDRFLSPEEEKKRYDLHQNTETDGGYRRHLSRLFSSLQQHLAPGSRGLDFGSGPEPVLSRMFADAGHVMTLFDRFYEPEQQAFDRQYDFIIAAEVVEHLQEPKRELERLWACLKPGGWLGIMTQYAVPKDAFPRWHYKNDLTHVCFFSTATFAWIARALNAELTFAERDVVLFRKKPASPRLLPAQSEERPLTPLLPILYQDDYLVAVNKPSGMLVHRSDIDFHERENAMKILRDRLGRWVYPFHRLDKAASGVLLFALDRETARYMTELFSGGMISKTYLAIVRGFTKERERIDYALKEIGDRMTDGNADRERAPKVAVTEYRRLATVEIPEPVGRYATARYSLLQVMPSTGRKHQIRRHMKHIFHPIAGDTTYGDGRQNAFFRARFQVNRLLLHASAVGFSHPRTGARLDIAAPPDETFRMLLDTLLWNKDVHCDR